MSIPGAAAQITLRHLLNATAGLPSDYQPHGRRDPVGLCDYVYDEIVLTFREERDGLMQVIQGVNSIYRRQMS